MARGTVEEKQDLALGHFSKAIKSGNTGNEQVERLIESSAKRIAKHKSIIAQKDQRKYASGMNHEAHQLLQEVKSQQPKLQRHIYHSFLEDLRSIVTPEFSYTDQHDIRRQLGTSLNFVFDEDPNNKLTITLDKVSVSNIFFKIVIETTKKKHRFKEGTKEVETYDKVETTEDQIRVMHVNGRFFMNLIKEFDKAVSKYPQITNKLKKNQDIW